MASRSEICVGTAKSMPSKSICKNAKQFLSSSVQITQAPASITYSLTSNMILNINHSSSTSAPTDIFANVSRPEDDERGDDINFFVPSYSLTIDSPSAHLNLFCIMKIHRDKKDMRQSNMFVDMPFILRILGMGSLKEAQH
jgi:hypothetical protein